MSQNILLPMHVPMGPRTSPNWHTFNLQLRIGSTRRAPCPIVILFLKPTPFLSTSNLNAIAFQGGVTRLVKQCEMSTQLLHRGVAYFKTSFTCVFLPLPLHCLFSELFASNYWPEFQNFIYGLGKSGQLSMRKAGRLSLSITYYHNISFAIAAGGCVLTHFSGGFKSVRIARSPNSRGRLSLNFCQPDQPLLQ